jgi:hypothetical protein
MIALLICPPKSCCYARTVTNDLLDMLLLLSIIAVIDLPYGVEHADRLPQGEAIASCAGCVCRAAPRKGLHSSGTTTPYGGFSPVRLQTGNFIMIFTAGWRLIHDVSPDFRKCVYCREWTDLESGMNT